MKRIGTLGIVFVSLAAVLPDTACGQNLRNELLADLEAGRIDEGQRKLRTHLDRRPQDSTARLGLGIFEILEAVEALSQSLHRHGLRLNPQFVPFRALNVPVISSGEPEPIDYEKFRAIVQQWINNLRQAEATLARVDTSNVKLAVPIGMIRLDLDGDDEASEPETFWRVFSHVALGGAAIPPGEREFPIHFDGGDVHWMRGYCNLLMAVGEIYLAYDAEQFFEFTAYIFFEGASPPFEFRMPEDEGGAWEPDEIADLIAALHLFQWEPTEPERLQRAHKLLLAVCEQSRRSWERIEQETDDEREWIPHAKQTSLLPGVRVTQERIDAWLQVVDHAEAVLKGEKLIPHWRMRPPRGLNVRKIFFEPQPLDLVLWIQGSGVVPFVEEGDVTDAGTWRRMRDVFGGNFLVFAIWFN